MNNNINYDNANLKRLFHFSVISGCIVEIVDFNL